MLTVAVSPGVVLLSYFYLRDLYETEPLRSVLTSFVLGMLAVLPVLALQKFLASYIHSTYLHVFLVASGTEELFKFLVVAAFIYRSREVNEIYDGILYSVAVSLGFATVENVFSVMQQGWETAAIRAFLPVPGHALFAVVMGYYAGKSKFVSSRFRALKLSQAILYAWLLHAVYDLILASSQYFWGMLIIPFMLMLWFLGLRKMKLALHKSPFKPKDS
jgi:RsiW-degrading membrane proteinase PrsW (M82 family)